MYKIFAAISCRRDYYCPLAKYFLPMKLSLLIVLTAFLQTYGKGFAQKVNIKVENAQLLTVFDQLREQTGFDFIYNFDLIKKAKPVSLDFRNAPLGEVLDQCLSRQALTYRIENTTVIIKKAQKEDVVFLRLTEPPVNISGKITDDKGAPLPGVTVRVKNGNTITVSDSEGNYKITVPDNNAVLVFSFIGFASQEVPVTGKQSINLSLKPQSSGLQEVVVVSVGYGTLNKREISSAITHVSSKDLLSVGSNSPLMALQGKVAGLNITNTASGDPNSMPSLQLRGVSSRKAGL